MEVIGYMQTLCVLFYIRVLSICDFPGGSDGKASAYNAGDPGSIPGSGRSSGEGNSSPPQYSCLENPMDRRAWSATIPGVSKSRTRLSNFTFLSLWVLKFDTGITAPGQTDQNTCYSGRKNWAGFTQLHSIPIE